jgi:hypothetical protein
MLNFSSILIQVGKVVELYWSVFQFTSALIYSIRVERLPCGVVVPRARVQRKHSQISRQVRKPEIADGDVVLWRCKQGVGPTQERWGVCPRDSRWMNEYRQWTRLERGWLILMADSKSSLLWPLGRLYLVILPIWDKILVCPKDKFLKEEFLGQSMHI